MTSAPDLGLDHARVSSESDYVQRLRRREPAALTRLYREQVEYIERLMYRVLGPDPSHQDLVQEVFLSAIESFGRFRGQEPSLRPWLAKIAVHRARKLLRRRRVRRFVGLSASGELPEAPSADNPEIQTSLRLAFDAVARLGPEERLVFSLHVIQQMTLEEVAEVAGVSLSTAKRRFAKARRRVERAVAERETPLSGGRP
ncbi:MAG: sigma-70 family RNA polymerase sigma factor [Myxococcota bacterium]